MSERLPSERCPFCDSQRAPLPWSIDAIHNLTRGYRCADCARTWSVDGLQQSMFDDDLAQDAPLSPGLEHSAHA